MSSAPIAIDIVVEGELLVLLDVSLGEDAHAHTVADRPLRDVAVGGAGMVREASDAATLGCVDELAPKGEIRAPITVSAPRTSSFCSIMK